jgi:F-type H+-transporting ATPase subunit alpha
VEDQVLQIDAATNGYLDRIKVERVEEFLEQLVLRFRSEKQDLAKKIAAGEWTDEIPEELDAFVRDFADDFGFDLDEEGQPLDEDAAPERRTTPAAGDEAEEPEPEPEPEPAAV